MYQFSLHRQLCNAMAFHAIDLNRESNELFLGEPENAV
jgi:hypothetical protein